MKNDEKTFLRLKRLVWGCFSLRYCDSLVIHSDETFALTFFFENDVLGVFCCVMLCVSLGCVMCMYVCNVNVYYV